MRCDFVLPGEPTVYLVQVSVDCLANDSGSTVTLFFLKTLLFAIMPFLFSLLALSLIFLGVFISKRCFDKIIEKEARNATLVTANIVFLFSSFLTVFLPDSFDRRPDIGYLNILFVHLTNSILHAVHV